ncbi:MAG: DNA-methyltransferase [Phycisphaerae bacterium]
MAVENEVIQGDCIEWLRSQEEPFADLVFADPPFNIGYKYDVYEDRKAYDDYYQWTHDWMQGCSDVLKPAGAFWVAIGAEYAAEVRMIGRQLGLTLRNWIIWHYTFGQNTKAKFARAHVHLFYFTKSPTDFTFNREAVAVFSDRQKEYNDKRASSLGRVPFDVWTEFPRVCGSFAEREGWHPCQMPEALLARIVRACSNLGDMVFDPFSGSGTTLAVAKKLGRRYAGTELSEDYATNIRRRLDESPTPAELDWSQPAWPNTVRRELASLYMENSLGPQHYRQQPHLWRIFVEQFNKRMESIGLEANFEPDAVWEQLALLQRDAMLGRIKVHLPTVGEGRFTAPPGQAGDGSSAKKAPAPRRKTRRRRSSAEAPGGGLF